MKNETFRQLQGDICSRKVPKCWSHSKMFCPPGEVVLECFIAIICQNSLVQLWQQFSQLLQHFTRLAQVLEILSRSKVNMIDLNIWKARGTRMVELSSGWSVMSEHIFDRLLMLVISSRSKHTVPHVPNVADPAQGVHDWNRANFSK